MSEDASSAVDSQGKNFRTSYYKSLLFRGEEEKNVGCLESLLKAENIGKNMGDSSYMYIPCIYIIYILYILL